jgi:hypothetical protein
MVPHQKSIEDLSLLCGAIHWDQIYLAIVVWALELMEDENGMGLKLLHN